MKGIAFAVSSGLAKPKEATKAGNMIAKGPPGILGLKFNKIRPGIAFGDFADLDVSSQVNFQPTEESPQSLTVVSPGVVGEPSFQRQVIEKTSNLKRHGLNLIGGLHLNLTQVSTTNS